MANLKTIKSTKKKKSVAKKKDKKVAGLLDGTLEQKIKRLENLSSPKQHNYGSPANKKAIDKLRRNIRMSA